jgi:hypothetical protein
MSTNILLTPLSKLSKADEGGFKVAYPRSSTASRDGELDLSGTQLLFYFGIALITTGLLTWAGVHYLVFAR